MLPGIWFASLCDVIGTMSFDVNNWFCVPPFWFLIFRRNAMMVIIVCTLIDFGGIVAN